MRTLNFQTASLMHRMIRQEGLFKWYTSFKTERTGFKGDKRTGNLLTSTTPIVVERLETLLREF